MLLSPAEVSSVRLKLSKIEISPLSRIITVRAKETVRVFEYVYFGVTGLELICLCIPGLSFFDACAFFATTATGGFSTRMQVCFLLRVWIESILYCSCAFRPCILECYSFFVGAFTLCSVRPSLVIIYIIALAFPCFNKYGDKRHLPVFLGILRFAYFRTYL